MKNAIEALANIILIRTVKFSLGEYLLIFLELLSKRSC